MVSYSNSSYENEFFDLTGIYFNSTSQSSSNIDIDELDTRYLQKSGGTISNNLIVSGSVDIQTTLTIPNIGNVENAIEGKQPTINDGDLTIAKTNGLQGALENKQDDIDNTTDLTARSLTIDGGNLVVGTTNVISEIGTKQPTINDGDLTIAKTLNLQSSLDVKQDLITNFEINGNVVLNTSGNNFDTIVIRRANSISGIVDDYVIDLEELQVWVNNTNIMVDSQSILKSYVASWANKEVDIGFKVIKVHQIFIIMN